MGNTATRSTGEDNAAEAARPTRLLDKREVCARLSISVSTLYDRILAGDLSRPVKIGVASRWPEAEIDSYIARKLSERDAQRQRAAGEP